MATGIDDNLLQQAGTTVLILCAGTAVLTALFQLTVWMVRVGIRQARMHALAHDHGACDTSGDGTANPTV